IFYLIDRLALVDHAVLAHDVRGQPVAQGEHDPVNPVTIAECHDLLPLLSSLFCYYPSPPAPSPTRGEGEDGSHSERPRLISSPQTTRGCPPHPPAPLPQGGE